MRRWRHGDGQVLAEGTQELAAEVRRGLVPTAGLPVALASTASAAVTAESAFASREVPSRDV